MLLFAFTAFAFGLNAQTIPNNDFENWTTHDDPANTGVVMDSLESGVWESGNPLILVLPALESGMPKGFMYDTSFAYSGNHAAAMRTGLLNGLMATGNLFMGVIDASIDGINAVINEGNPLAPATTGVPSTAMPSILKGYYYYEPGADYIFPNYQTQTLDTIVGGGDTCRIICMVHKWNVGLNQRDTIGFGEFSTSSTSTGYAPFELELDYYNSNTPDSLSVMMLSSYGGLAFSGAYGSLLIVDSLSFEGDYLSVTKSELENFVMYSNENGIVFDNFSMNDEYFIFDLTGRTIANGKLNKGYNEVVFDYSGIVVVSVQRGNQNVINRKINKN